MLEDRSWTGDARRDPNARTSLCIGSTADARRVPPALSKSQIGPMMQMGPGFSSLKSVSEPGLLALAAFARCRGSLLGENPSGSEPVFV